MNYIVESKKSIEALATSLEENIKAKGFGVLHVHNLEKTMRSKGIELGESCRVYEVCNPQIAQQVLREDMNMNMLLPCRISIYTDKGITKIGMIMPSTLMQSSSHESELSEITQGVEATTKEIIDLSV